VSFRTFCASKLTPLWTRLTWKSLCFDKKNSFLPGHWGAGPLGPPFVYASDIGWAKLGRLAPSQFWTLHSNAVVRIGVRELVFSSVHVLWTCLYSRRQSGDILPRQRNGGNTRCKRGQRAFRPFCPRADTLFVASFGEWVVCRRNSEFVVVLMLSCWLPQDSSHYDYIYIAPILAVLLVGWRIQTSCFTCTQ